MFSEQEVKELLKETKEKHARLTREYKNNPPKTFAEAKERFETIRTCMVTSAVLYQVLGKKEASNRTRQNITLLSDSLKEHYWKR